MIVYGTETIDSTEYQTAVLGPSAPEITAKIKDASGATYTSGTWTNQNVYVELRSESIGAGIKRYRWSEDGGESWSTTNLTTTDNVGTITFKVERNGEIKFSAVDNNNVGSAMSKITIRKEVTVPTITYGTNGGTYTIPAGSTTVSISSKLTAADTGGSGLNTLKYAWSQSNTTQPTSWTTFTNGGSVTKAATGGNWYLWVQITDKAGNTLTTKSDAFTVKYQVKYDANGGTGAPSAQTKTYKTALTLSTTKPTYTGHTFKEWNTKSDGSETGYASGGSYTKDSSATLYAIWTANNYNITYNYNGVKNYIEPISSSVKFAGFTGKENTCISLGEVYKDDLEAGDKLNVTFSVSYSGLTAASGQTASALVQGEGDVTGWSNCFPKGTTVNWLGTGTDTYSYTTYSLTSDQISNGKFDIELRTDYYSAGTITITNIKVTRVTTKTVSKAYNTTLGTLPAPVEDGYTLNGWYTATSGGTEILPTTKVTGSATYYARWTANNYTVTYDYKTNGGSSATKTSATVASDGVIDLTPTATKDGWTFVGWNTNKDETTGLSYLNMRSSNIKLYAIYSKTITGSFKYYNNQTKTVSETIYNQAVSANIITPEALGTPSGYTFRGWSDGSNGNATIKVGASKSVTLTANKTYYASYSYTITIAFNGNGATSGTAPANQTGTGYMNYVGTKIGHSFTMPSNTFTKTGYTFKEWNANTGGTGASYTVGTAYTFTANKTLYAKWNQNNYEELNSSGTHVKYYITLVKETGN